MRFLLKNALCVAMALSATVCVMGREAGSFAANSNPNGEYVTTQAGTLSPKASKIWQLAHPGMPVPTPKATTFKAPLRAEEGEATYTVSPVFTECPELNLMPAQYSFAFPADNPGSRPYQAMYFGPDFSFPFNLPAGTYDFVFFYAWNGEGEECDGIRCIVKEDIEVNADMEIVADPAEATEHIAFRPLLPNGERVRMERWVEVEPEKWEMVDAGNCEDAEYYTMFSYMDNLFMTFSMNIVDRTDENGNVITGSVYGDAWVTPSSKIGVAQKDAVMQEDGNSLIAMVASGAVCQEISNDPANFTEPMSANFADCYIMPEIEKENQYSPDPYLNGILAFITFIDGEYSAINALTLGGMTWDYTTYRVCVDPTAKPEISLIPQFSKIFAQDFDARMAYSIVAPMYSPEDNKWVAGHQSSMFTNNDYLDLANNEAGMGYGITYNYNYSVPATDDVVFGDNAPVTTFLRPSNQFGYSFVGRYGEVRTIDLYSSTLSVKLDGEEVCSDYFGLMDFFWSEEGKKEGAWSMEINNENIMVDGLQGRNHCVMNFVKDADRLTPTVMQMQMRTEDDRVTDRFAKPEEGLLTFYAGGFQFTYDNVTWAQWYDYDPLDEVIVEYAPYGSEDFAGLEVKEDAGKFFMPGYGTYYYSELDQVSAKSNTGWYDVRISLRDSKGSTQVQTVSPAFFIESMTGIDTISDDAAGNGFEGAMPVYYTIDGVAIGNNRPTSNGIYIEKRGSKISKIAVGK